MAFTKSPEQDTYKTVNMEFTAAGQTRTADLANYRDNEILNLYWDRISNENKTRSLQLKKRPGITNYQISETNVTLSVADVIGSFYDSSENIWYYAGFTSKKIYSLDLGTGISTEILTFTSSSSNVGFTDFLTSSGTRYICASNGEQLFVINASTGVDTEVTDAQLPSPHHFAPVFLDGYLFLVKEDTGDVYNSDFDDPTSWTAGNFITTEISADFAIRLAKQKNYLIVFGKRTIEFFYDAGIASGSPLQRNESYVKYISLVGSYASYGDSIIFAGITPEKSIAIYEIVDGSVRKISNQYIDRLLDPNFSNSFQDQAHCFGVDGHDFYYLWVGYDSSNTKSYSFVYDLNEKFWYRWQLNTNPTYYIDSTAQLLTGKVIFTLNSTSLLTFDPTIYQDQGSNFTCTYITEEFDGGTFNWKSCHRVGIFCDQHQNTGTSNLAISWSDDDGSSFSTARNVNVFSQNPYLTQCGRFRNRIWKLSYTDNYPFRFRGLTMDLNIGTI